MQIDALIIGQGVSGTFLSYFLQQENKMVLVIDQPRTDAPSRVAGGIINPVTGRRMVTVWLVEELFPFVWKTYNEIGNLLNVPVISQKTIIDFFPNPFMRESFLKRISQQNDYVHSYPEQNDFNTFFNYEFGCGEIRPAYVAHLEVLLPAWKAHLKQQGNLREEIFDTAQLELSDDTIRYKDITARHIIFCDGALGGENPFFGQLPFAFNKGEALVVEIPGLPNQHIYKKSMLLSPMAQQDMFWLGTSYDWDFTDSNPTEAFREQAERSLQHWLKVPFKVMEHSAAIRPATVERRPFAGLHPVHRNVGLLNGMGTKGCSLAPFFARQLTDHILYNTGITAEADISRYKRILSRQ
jgi:glycine/D-amino acid oxidase-like deaminating enzyme